MPENSVFCPSSSIKDGVKGSKVWGGCVGPAQGPPLSVPYKSMRHTFLFRVRQTRDFVAVVLWLTLASSGPTPVAGNGRGFRILSMHIHKIRF